MPGLADEARVLAVGDRLDREEEIVDVDAMDGTFVVLRVVRAHEEFAGGNECEFGYELRRHSDAQEDSASLLFEGREIRCTLFAMKFEPFALERFQSIWENRVAWNVAESGVHPLRASDLADTQALRDAVLEQELGYPQTNGTAALREAIAAMYPGATIDHVQVTNGGSEANCVVLLRLVEPGDEIAFMPTNYVQIAGLARTLGATVRPWPMRE